MLPVILVDYLPVVLALVAAHSNVLFRDFYSCPAFFTCYFQLNLLSREINSQSFTLPPSNNPPGCFSPGSVSQQQHERINDTFLLEKEEPIAPPYFEKKRTLAVSMEAVSIPLYLSGH
jgi:hypothetical protein